MQSQSDQNTVSVGPEEFWIVVDLTAVDFIDSSGLGALVNGLKIARQAGGDLRISAPTDQVKLVLQLTNMERVLYPYPTVESAYAND